MQEPEFKNSDELFADFLTELDCIEKGQIAIKALRLLLAAGLISQEKLDESIRLAQDLKDENNG